MSVQLSQVLSTARTFLNDDNATTFTDAVLIPKIQEAHRELQEELWQVGSPVVRAQSAVLAVGAGVKLLNATSTPALPTDLLCPFALYENAAAKTIVDAGWTPMTEMHFIPLGTALTATLSMWSWQREEIVLLGSSADRTVVILYRKLITIPALTTDYTGMLFSESYLAARAAAIAAGTMGNAEVYAALTALAKENLGRVLTANRGQQKPALRP